MPPPVNYREKMLEAVRARAMEARQRALTYSQPAPPVPQRQMDYAQPGAQGPTDWAQALSAAPQPQPQVDDREQTVQRLRASGGFDGDTQAWRNPSPWVQEERNAAQVQGQLASTPAGGASIQDIINSIYRR